MNVQSYDYLMMTENGMTQLNYEIYDSIVVCFGLRLYFSV